MPRIPITIDSRIRIPAGECSPDFVAALEAATTLRDPNDMHRVAARGLERRGDTLILPRGLMQLVRAKAREAGVELSETFALARHTFDDAMVEPRLRDYQEAAVSALVQRRQGVVVIPCGGGKTHVGVAAIARLRQSALVLVHTADLAAQWCERIQACGALPGIVAGGEDKSRPITVALIQTLLQWPAQRLAAFLSRFGLIVLDEAHHVAAPTFGDIIGRAPCLYRLGLTATPIRADGLSDLMFWHFGPQIHRTTTAELARAGLRVGVRLEELRTGFDPSLPDGDPQEAWLAVQRELMACEARIRAIAAHLAQRAKDGHSVLCLGHRVDYCKALADATRGLGVDAQPLVGELNGKLRARRLEDARSGALPVIVGTSLADEGLDVPRLSCLVLAWPSSANAVGRLEQRVGRIARPHDEKPPAVVVDVNDPHCGMLRGMWRKRQPVLKQILGLDTATSAAPAVRNEHYGRAR